MDKGTEAEGRSGRGGKRRTLQHYSAYDPDGARMEAEGEDQHVHTHRLQ
jgi:hypothetical protein